MQRDTIRWLTGGLATILALAVSSNVVQGDYMPPSQSGSLLGEVSAFVGDFGSWNTRRDNLPVEFLAMTPTAQQGDAVVLLFWFWLHDFGTGTSEKSLPSSPPGSTALAGLSPPSSSGDPANPPTGSIVMGQLGNDPPSLHPNGGDDPPSIGGNGGSSSLLSDLPSPNGGGNSGQQPGNNQPVGGSAGDSGAEPFADPTPAPASFTLLAVGGAGLLMGLRKRRRRLA